LFIITNRERRELVYITLWESDRALEAIERSGCANQQAAKLSTVIAEAISGTTYEVAEAPQVKIRPRRATHSSIELSAIGAG